MSTVLIRSALCSEIAERAFISSSFKALSSISTEAIVVRFTDRTPFSVMTLTKGTWIVFCAFPDACSRV